MSMISLKRNEKPRQDNNQKPSRLKSRIFTIIASIVFTLSLLVNMVPAAMAAPLAAPAQKENKAMFAAGVETFDMTGSSGALSITAKANGDSLVTGGGRFSVTVAATDTIRITGTSYGLNLSMRNIVGPSIYTPKLEFDNLTIDMAQDRASLIAAVDIGSYIKATINLVGANTIKGPNASAGSSSPAIILLGNTNANSNSSINFTAASPDSGSITITGYKQPAIGGGGTTGNSLGSLTFTNCTANISATEDAAIRGANNNVIYSDAGSVGPINVNNSILRVFGDTGYAAISGGNAHSTADGGSVGAITVTNASDVMLGSPGTAIPAIRGGTGSTTGTIGNIALTQGTAGTMSNLSVLDTTTNNTKPLGKNPTVAGVASMNQFFFQTRDGATQVLLPGVTAQVGSGVGVLSRSVPATAAQNATVSVWSASGAGTISNFSKTDYFTSTFAAPLATTPRIVDLYKSMTTPPPTTLYAANDGSTTVNYALSSYVQGGRGTYTFTEDPSATDQLAAYGLSLTDGVIIGSYTGAAATPTFKFTVTDAPDVANGYLVAQSKTLEIPADFYAALAISPTTGINTYSMNASGGVAPLHYSISEVPAGMTFGTDGVLSGTPLDSGTKTLTFTVRDSAVPANTKTDTRAITLDAPLSLSVTGGTNSFGLITVSGGDKTGAEPYYTFSTTKPLPDGLVMDMYTGILSGNLKNPLDVGTTQLITLLVTDASGAVTSASAYITLSSTPPTLSVDNSVTNRLTPTVTDGFAPFTYAIDQDLTPYGLTFDPATGLISGTGNTQASVPLTYTVTDTVGKSATQQVTLAVDIPVPTLSMTVTPDASLPKISVNTTGGHPPYKYRVASSNSEGVVVDPDTGLITGITNPPLSAGEITFTLHVEDSGTLVTTASQSVTINYTPLTPAITPTSGVDRWNFLASATGGMGPYIFEDVSAKSLRSLGLSLDPDAGMITGTATEYYTYHAGSPLTIQVTDAYGTTKTINCTDLVINQVAPLTISCAVSDNHVVSNVSGGVGPYTFAIAPSTLPEGITFNTATGELTGIADTDPGATTYTITVIDSAGTMKTSSAFTIQRVLPPLSLSATVTENYKITPTVVSQAASYSFSATGTLPPGMSIDATSGELTGTPSEYGTYNFTLVVTDNYGTEASTPVTVTIQPTINSLSLDKATVGYAGGTAQVAVEGILLCSTTEVAVFDSTGAMVGAPLATTGTADSRAATITLPANTSPFTDSTYTVKARTSVDSAWDDASAQTIKVTPVPKGVAFLRSVVVKGAPTDLGGTVEVTASGANLENGKVKAALFDSDNTIVKGTETTATGDASTQTCEVSIPANTSPDTDNIYHLKVSVDGGKTWPNDHSSIIVVPRLTSVTKTSAVGDINCHGGIVTVSVDGTGLNNLMLTALFDSTNQVGTSVGLAGSDTKVSGELTIPANPSNTDAKVYTIKVSFDNGLTWVVVKDITVPKTIMHKVIKAPKQDVVGKAQPLNVEFEGNAEDVLHVFIDGVEFNFTKVMDPSTGKFASLKIIDPKTQLEVGEITQGSIAVTIHAAFMDTLAEGRHDVDLITKDGFAQYTFWIKRNTGPSLTGDNSHVLGWFALMLVASAGLIAVVYLNNRKRKKNR